MTGTAVTLGDVIVKTLWMAGLAIVVSMSIAVVIKLIVVVQDALQRKPATAPKPVAVAEPAYDALGDHIAAISAAVYSIIGAHRIVHIEEHRHTEWAVEGRMAHHASHAVPHRPKH